MARFAWTITEDTDTVSIISSSVKNNDFFFSEKYCPLIYLYSLK
jgi:hypothetical protein